jgi:hypothetical protein
MMSPHAPALGSDSSGMLGVGGAKQVQPHMVRAIADIKVVQRLDDGTGFIARDRMGGMTRGVAW